MNAPLVSVLIPCYNIEPYGEIAINSILSQTYKHIEVLLLNDGSADKTASIIAAFEQSDSRVRVIEHDKNKGIIRARNRLLDEASGQYLAWMDADDIAREDRLEKQVAFLEAKQNYAAVSCEYEEFSDSSRFYCPRKEKELSRDYLLFYNYVLNPGAMVRQEVITRQGITFDNTLSGASDFQFWVDVAKAGQIGVIHEPLMQYRRHSEQESTAQMTRQLRGCQEIVARQLNALGYANADPDRMACFLIYPADLLNKKYSMASFRYSAEITQYLLQILPNHQFTEEAVEQAIHLLRRHVVRVGILAIPLYIKTVGLRRFLAGKHFGWSLVRASMKKKY
ncbi:MAG: hypothetical protein CL586_10700 [Alteromonadaceae bacterium]|nr:hypothetical protein [Alteromonadaceae bacterium]